MTSDVSNQVDSTQVLPKVLDRDGKSLRTIKSDNIKNIDQVDANTTYIGFAEPGTADISPLWRIMLVTVSGTVTKIRWAGGTSEYVNSWTNRASLTYS